MSGLPYQIGNHPMFVSQLNRVAMQGQQLSSAQSAADQHPQHGIVSFTRQRIPSRTRQQSLALLNRKPVPDSDSEPAHSFDTADASGQFWAEQSGIGSLISDPSDSGQVEVDGGWCVLLLLEMDTIPQDDGAIECQAWF